MRGHVLLCGAVVQLALSLAAYGQVPVTAAVSLGPVNRVVVPVSFREDASPTTPPEFLPPPAAALPVPAAVSLDVPVPAPADDAVQFAQGGEAKEAGIVEKLGALEKGLGELSKNLTVVTGDPGVKIVIAGTITADFLYNSARPVASGIPFFLAPGPVAGFRQDSFDATARQSTLGFLVSMPEVCGCEASGVILLSLYNDALIVDRYGILPVLAYGQLKN